MRAMQLDRPRPVAAGPLRPVELPAPEPEPGELLVAVEACAVCRTDLQICEGDLTPRRLPIVPGHQLAGRVAAVGDAVAGWAIGDPVGAGWLAGTCGACEHCRSGRENLCGRATFTGWDRNGGFAEQARVRADFALRLPGGRSLTQTAPLLCGGVIGYRALRVSGIQPGQRLGLYGFGASALLAIQVAVHWGCEVYVVTRSGAERQRALSLGAVWAGGAHDDPPAPLQAAVTFAPVGDVVVAALRAVDRGGVVAINAIHLDRIPEFPYELLWGERQLRSVANYTRADAAEFLDLAATIPVESTYEAHSLADANTALGRLRAGDVAGAGVLVV